VTEQQVTQIPISDIRIVNPRTRNKTRWHVILSSIRAVGLKKPITVVPRHDSGADRTLYDLVMGQGRMEAMAALGELMIPAVVIEATEEDRHLMSLVENIARRPPSTRALLGEVRSLRGRGYSIDQIAEKIGLERSYIHGISHLVDRGEELLIASVESGKIPLTIAIEIASGNDTSVSRALSEAYEKGELKGAKVRAARRIISQRLAKQRKTGKSSTERKQLTGEALVREYKAKIQEQSRLVKKAERTRENLILISSAMRTLLNDENFRILLKAEGLQEIPSELAARLQ